MAKKLATHVHVHQRDADGNVSGTQVYGPDDKVPAAVAKEIGDHCWADESDSEADATARTNASPASS